MQLALAKGRAADERWHVRKDGSRFWSSGALLPLRHDAGATIGFLKILRDRTTEREAEDALRRLNATLEERVARRTIDLTAANERLKAAACGPGAGRGATASGAENGSGRSADRRGSPTTSTTCSPWWSAISKCCKGAWPR